MTILKLYSEKGAELTKMALLNGDMYYMPAIGNDMVFFYFDYTKVESLDTTTILFYTTDKVNLTARLEYYKDSKWFKDCNWSSDDFDMNAMDCLNCMYPMIESSIYWPKRLCVMHDNTCNIFCEITTE